MRMLLLIVPALLVMVTAMPSRGSEPLRVAVAANFRHTLGQLNHQFTAQTGIPVILSSASTGVLYSQIIYGAPFDVFFAADAKTPAQLNTNQIQSFCYARGRLVLVGGDGDLSALSDAARSLAIPNPEIAPYGRAALEVLARPEFESGKKRKLLRGNNVVQAYQFWYSGGADLALVPLALKKGATPIPNNWHEPLDQHAIALRPGEATNTYLNWIRSDTVRALIYNAGYEPCP